MILTGESRNPISPWRFLSRELLTVAAVYAVAAMAGTTMEPPPEAEAAMTIAMVAKTSRPVIMLDKAFLLPFYLIKFCCFQFSTKKMSMKLFLLLGLFPDPLLPCILMCLMLRKK